MKDILLLGYSGSGKSPIARLIKERNSVYEEIHTIKPLYEFLASIYDVDVNWLMSPEGKASKCGDGDKTFHEVLIDLYLYHEKHKTNWGLNMLKKQVYNSEWPMIFSGMRNKNEFDFLLKYYDSDELIVCWLEPSWKVQPKDSEHYLSTAYKRLQDKFFYKYFYIESTKNYSKIADEILLEAC